MGKATAHEHVGEAPVVDEAAGERAIERRFDGLGLEALARKALAQLLGSPLAHEAEPLDLAESGVGIGEPHILVDFAGVMAGRLSAGRTGRQGARSAARPSILPLLANVGKVGRPGRLRDALLDRGDLRAQTRAELFGRFGHATSSSQASPLA